MAGKSRVSVRLGDMRPGANPRKDFGDIDAMAATIEATGGQPVNPPVVVRDGDVYRIIDGERRWRALVKLYGEDGTADVLCYENCDEAEEAVAMVATDAKKELTDSERGFGFQRMIMLGIPEGRVAKAMRRSVADVRKASKVASIAPEQATMDQMIAAAEFEDEDERQEVLGAKGGMWRQTVQNIERKHRLREAFVPLDAELERWGIPVVDKVPENYNGGDWCGTAQSISDWAESHDWGLAVAKKYDWGAGYFLYLPKENKVEVETPEQAEARIRKARIESDVEDLALALMEYVAKAGEAPCLQVAVGRIRGGDDVDRDSLDECFEDVRRRLGTQDVEDGELQAALTCTASVYEVLKALTYMIDYSTWHWWRDVEDYLTAAKGDGYVASSEDEWLLEQAVEEHRRHDAEEGDE